MYCANCGGTIQPSQNFCNRCGQATTASPVRSQQPLPPLPAPTLNAAAPVGVALPPGGQRGIAQPARLAKHLQILGIIWIAVSIFRLIPAIAMIFIGRTGIPFATVPLRGFLMPLMGALGIFLGISSVIGILVGWGLIDRRPWARILAIVVGCLKLIDIPFGTALGIYTLWVLASQGAEEQYQRMARVS
jgi:hypothetical protein